MPQVVLLADKLQKECPGCNVIYPVEHYGVRTKADPRPRSRCRDCVRTARRNFARANPEWVKHYRLKAHYGIGYAEYQAMLKTQKGVCAICSQPATGKQPYLAVDHDHKTGKVRALLCPKCNMAIGGVNEDPAILRKMIKYIKKHSEMS